MITTAENRNAETPASTESDSSVSSTLVLDIAPDDRRRTRLESAQVEHLFRVGIAGVGFDLEAQLAETEHRKVRPEKAADWAMQSAMPSQIRDVRDG